MFVAILLAAAAINVAASDGAASDRLRIEVLDSPAHVRVVAPLPDELIAAAQGRLDAQPAGKVLRLCVVDEQGEPGPAIFGSYQRQDDLLIFAPRYALARGQTYRAILALSSNQSVTRDYRVPALEPSEPTVVERIDPGSEVLPANLLKFYLHFSKPMREGQEIFDLVQLLDGDGRPIADPWRRTELWTPDARRFTLWMHPGRVKQGVNLREEEGPVLAPGARYTLVVSGRLRDADGQPLGRDFEKHFRTVEEDRRRPLPEQWKIQASRAGSRDPLRVEFGEPLDHALLFRFIKIRGADGHFLTGTIVTEDNDAAWLFRPAEAWSDAKHQIVVVDLLEDLAGNTPARVFDTDLQQPLTTPPQLTRDFRPISK